MNQEHIAINLTEQGNIPYLSDIYPEGLPEGIVLNKTICGLGATYSCIKKACHTIIIELNLPVIQSKVYTPIHAEDNLFGVIGGTKTEDIVSYIKRTLKKGMFINILCTPESYYKLQDALIETMGDTYYSEIFFVLDEIQRFPKAREAVKYLVADGRYDYIETGSLISIKENINGITIPSEERPVNMYPMDFEEFAWAMGEEQLAEYIRKCFEGVYFFSNPNSLSMSF